MDLIALSGLTVSLGPILVASVFDAAIAIVHGDRDVHRGRRSRRRAAVAIVCLVRVPQHPLRPAAPVRLKRIDHSAPLPLERKRRGMVDSTNRKIDRLSAGKAREFANLEVKCIEVL